MGSRTQLYPTGYLGSGTPDYGAIALSYPPIVIDDSSWKNVAESFTVAQP